MRPWKRAALLKPALDALLAGTDAAARVRSDPVELPHRYADPQDVSFEEKGKGRGWWPAARHAAPGRQRDLARQRGADPLCNLNSMREHR